METNETEETEPFQIVDRKWIAPKDISALRRRLTGICGESFFVRLRDYSLGAREVWKSHQGQHFTVVYRMGRYELQEITFDEAEMIPVNPPD